MTQCFSLRSSQHPLECTQEHQWGRGLRGPSQESQPGGISRWTKPPGMESDEDATFLLQIRGQEGFQAVGLVAHISQIQQTIQKDTKKLKG